MAKLFSGHTARFYFNKIKLEPTSNKYFMVYIDDLTGYDVH